MKKNETKKLIFVWIIASIILALLIHFLFSLSTNNNWLIAKWSAGEILTYVSTVALALLAVWQNIKFQEENDKLQEKLTSIVNEGNNINIINKIIEYEMDNLMRLREAFEDFSQYADPRSICSLYGKSTISLKEGFNTDDIIAVSSAMMELHNKLEGAFLSLSRELRIDLMVREHDDNNLKKAVSSYYVSACNLILQIRQHPEKSFGNEMEACEKQKNIFLMEREKYLIEQENKMNKLLYENLSIEKVKDMYHR